MWSFHIPTREWTEFYAKSRIECWPSPMFDHTAVSISLSRKRFEKFLMRYPEIGKLSDLQQDENCFPLIEKFYNQMYIFGGYNSSKHFSNDLYCYDFTFKKFIKIEYTGKESEMIMERSRHCMVSVQDQYLYIIGGMTDKSKTLMDVWEYDIDRNVMKCLSKHSDQYSESFPNSRTYHSCVYSKLNHSIYMFGGIRNNEAFQDLWRFDLRALQWFPIDNMKGFVPVERFRHNCFIPNEESGYFFVYGGYNFRHSFLDYIYQFDFSTLEWTRLQNRNYTQGGDFQSKGSLMFVDYDEIPCARSGMTSIITKSGDLIIFGGKSVTCLNDMFSCRLPGYSKLRAGRHNLLMEKMYQKLHSADSFVDITFQMN